MSDEPDGQNRLLTAMFGAILAGLVISYGIHWLRADHAMELETAQAAPMATSAAPATTSAAPTPPTPAAPVPQTPAPVDAASPAVPDAVAVPRAPAAAQDGRARLTVRSTPAGVVYVDGQPVGTSPVEAHAVTPGRHEVEVRLGAHQSRAQTVNLRKGGHEQLSFRLSPEAAQGTLTVRSSPDAVVYVDGAPVGTTPLEGHLVDVGSHEIELRLGGHTTERRQVQIDASRPSELDLVLSPVP